MNSAMGRLRASSAFQPKSARCLVHAQDVEVAIDDDDSLLDRVKQATAEPSSRRSTPPGPFRTPALLRRRVERLVLSGESPCQSPGFKIAFLANGPTKPGCGAEYASPLEQNASDQRNILDMRHEPSMKGSGEA
jgi:hypothetical protein